MFGVFADIEYYNWLSLSFLFLLLASFIFGYRITSFIALILNAFIPINTLYGAESVAWTLLLYTCFISHRNKDYDFLALLGVVVLFGTLNVIYLYNFIAKMNDLSWTEGRAIRSFLPEVATHIPDAALTIIDPIISYGTIALQFSIFLILIKKTRKFVTLSFVLMHAIIALALPYFGLLCLVSHLFVLAYGGDIFKDLKNSLSSSHK